MGWSELDEEEAQATRAAVDAAVLREREACARLAKGAHSLVTHGDDFNNGWASAALQIAQAIMMRNAESSGAPKKLTVN